MITDLGIRQHGQVSLMFPVQPVHIFQQGKIE
jgi:hypothetical protein